MTDLGSLRDQAQHRGGKQREHEIRAFGRPAGAQHPHDSQHQQRRDAEQRHMAEVEQCAPSVRVARRPAERQEQHQREDPQRGGTSWGQRCETAGGGGSSLGETGFIG
jgi:hypothetical protein